MGGIKYIHGMRMNVIKTLHTSVVTQGLSSLRPTSQYMSCGTRACVTTITNVRNLFSRSCHVKRVDHIIMQDIMQDMQDMQD